MQYYHKSAFIAPKKVGSFFVSTIRGRGIKSFFPSKESNPIQNEWI